VWSFDPASITCALIVLNYDDDQLMSIGHSEHAAEITKRNRGV